MDMAIMHVYEHSGWDLLMKLIQLLQNDYTSLMLANTVVEGSMLVGTEKYPQNINLI